LDRLIYNNVFKFDVNHTRIRSWDQPVLSNDGKVSCPRKQREHVVGLGLTSYDVLHTAPRRPSSIRSAHILVM